MPSGLTLARPIAGPRSFARTYASAGAFNGTDRKVTTGWTGITGTAARTVTAWLKTTNAGTAALLSYGTNTLGNKFAVQHTGPALGLACTSSNILFALPSGNGRWNDGTWHHVALVMPASATLNDLQVYADGYRLYKVASSTAATTAINTLANIVLGLGYDPVINSSFFNGSLCDVQMYASALSASQVASIWAQGHTLSGASLAGWWLFDDGSGTSVADRSGNAHPGGWGGTLAGAQWTTGPSIARSIVTRAPVDTRLRFDVLPSTAPELILAGDPYAAGTFYGYLDPCIRRDSVTGRLWLAYSYAQSTVPPSGGAVVPNVEIHYGHSDDGGVTWTFDGTLFPATFVDLGGGNVGYRSVEVNNILPITVGGVTSWVGIRWTYYIPQVGGFGGVPANSRRFELSLGSTLAAVGTNPKAILASSLYSDSWGAAHVHLDQLAPYLSTLDTTEPSLYFDGATGTLYLLCQSGHALMVFSTPMVGAVTAWVWTAVGPLVTSADAVSLGIGAVGFTQGELCFGRDGQLLLLASPLRLDPYYGPQYGGSGESWDHFGVWVFEVASLATPALVHNADGSIRVRAVLTASDLGTFGPGSASYNASSGTGILMARRHFNQTPTYSTLHATGVIV